MRKAGGAGVNTMSGIVEELMEAAVC